MPVENITVYMIQSCLYSRMNMDLLLQLSQMKIFGMLLTVYVNQNKVDVVISVQLLSQIVILMKVQVKRNVVTLLYFPKKTQ
jgi:hypothetical protein